jgi:hypothetical protein
MILSVNHLLVEFQFESDKLLGLHKIYMFDIINTDSTNITS